LGAGVSFDLAFSSFSAKCLDDCGKKKIIGLSVPLPSAASHSESSTLDRGRPVQRRFCASYGGAYPIIDSVLKQILDPEKHGSKKEAQRNRRRTQEAQTTVSTPAAHA
jgi:hypothetical protein